VETGERRYTQHPIEVGWYHHEKITLWTGHEKFGILIKPIFSAVLASVLELQH
jgi:hypothetical protein